MKCLKLRGVVVFFKVPSDLPACIKIKEILINHKGTKMVKDGEDYCRL